MRDGGIIILAASCKEGLGEKVFEQWILHSESPQAMVERIGREFQLGGHKAAAISMVLGRVRIFLVSDLEDESKVIFMPHGGSVLPQVE